MHLIWHVAQVAIIGTTMVFWKRVILTHLKMGHPQKLSTCADLQMSFIELTWQQRYVPGLYSLSGRMSYRKISRSLEVARSGFKLFKSLWNLTGTSAAVLPKCLSKFRGIRSLKHPISWLRDVTRFGGHQPTCIIHTYLLSCMPVSRSKNTNFAKITWE